MSELTTYLPTQQPPSYFDNREKYIYSVTWPTNGEVAFTWENRYQNYSVVSVCEALSGKTMLSLIYPDHSPVSPADCQDSLVTCLSCDELNTRGGSCGYNCFDFSSDKSYYAMSCDGPHVPQVYLYQTNPNQRLTTLVDNSKLTADLASKSLPKVSNLNIRDVSEYNFCQNRNTHNSRSI